MVRSTKMAAVVLTAGLGGFGLWSTGFAQPHDHEAKGKEVELSGEVVDLHCFMLHPDTGKGEKHAKCAKTCMAKGLPIGFLTEGQVYLLLGPGHDSVKGLVAEQAGKTVKLKGVVVEHDGLKALQVKAAGAGQKH